MRKRILFVCMLAVALCLTFTGCDKQNINGGMINFVYDNPEIYSVGGTVIDMPGKTLDEVEIDWIAGKVQVVYGETDAVSIEETPNVDVESDMLLRYLFKDNKLTIKFATAGRLNVLGIKKSLVVKIPQTSNLKVLDISTLSGEIEVPEISAECIEADTVSGKITVNATSLKDEKITSVTGDVFLSYTGNESPYFDVKTTSGDANLDIATAKIVQIETISGDVNLSAANKVDEVIGETISGEVKFNVSKDYGYVVKFASTGGTISGDIALTRDGKRYVSGDGECFVNVKTVTSNFTFSGNEN